jgi:hypothetical protein
VRIPTSWTPTTENINNLPKPLRRFVHDLQSNCDPAGMIRENICLKENLAALQCRIEELESRLYGKRRGDC